MPLGLYVARRLAVGSLFNVHHLVTAPVFNNSHVLRLEPPLGAPVGLRYHALHHYLPTVPYHSLGALHRRLLAELPANDPYRRTRRPGVVAAALALARRAGARRACMSERQEA